MLHNMERGNFDHLMLIGTQSRRFHVHDNIAFLACLFLLCRSNSLRFLRLRRTAQRNVCVILRLLPIRRAKHQLDSIEILRNPCRVVYAKIHPLFVMGAENHRRTPVLHMFADSLPQFIPHPCADVSDIDARIEFNQPFGQVAAQPGRTIRQRHNGHVMSSFP